MKKIFKLLVLTVFATYLAAFNSWKKNPEIPTLGTTAGSVITTTTADTVIITTTAVTSITSTEAISGGNVSADGGELNTVRGVCWGTSTNPTISNYKSTDGSGIGSFTSNLTGLNPGTTYFVRAYITSSAGTAYGTQLSFTTSFAQDSWTQKADFSGFLGNNS